MGAIRDVADGAPSFPEIAKFFARKSHSCVFSQHGHWVVLKAKEPEIASCWLSAVRSCVESIRKDGSSIELPETVANWIGGDE